MNSSPRKRGANTVATCDGDAHITADIAGTLGLGVLSGGLEVLGRAESGDKICIIDGTQVKGDCHDSTGTYLVAGLAVLSMVSSFYGSHMLGRCKERLRREQHNALAQATGCYQLLQLADSYVDATADPDIAVAIALCRRQVEEQALVAHQRCSSTRLQTFSGVRSIIDTAARRQMLAGVGTCSADTAAHVRTWEIIKQASIAATEDSGCVVVQRSADELWGKDTQLYEAVFAPDPLIARCLTEEARRNTAEQCLVDRRQRRLEAEAITNPNERGRRMQALPKCR